MGKRLIDLGFTLVATEGTQKVLESEGLECAKISKVGEGRPDVSDLLKNEQIDLVINTTEGRQSIEDSAVIRRIALQKRVYYSTTLAGGLAACIAIKEVESVGVSSLQDVHKTVAEVQVHG